ncbi:unnamed protein product [Darwinula stevensoni]|uniref:Uncharacterized protein n=1 Tax=Darwinula stevensoni TaxID=69355 RepID=A0A7R9A5C8_9CRUS|nr:unnamed protein product [Darwinula stevensoni]CAG0895349.1 unnamed protein product [Darwinula stevensoni]
MDERVRLPKYSDLSVNPTPAGIRDESLSSKVHVHANWDAIRAAAEGCGLPGTASGAPWTASGTPGMALDLGHYICGMLQQLSFFNDTRAGDLLKCIAASFPDVLRKADENRLCIATRLGFADNSTISLQKILDFFTTSNSVKAAFACWDAKVAGAVASGGNLLCSFQGPRPFSSGLQGLQGLLGLQGHHGPHGVRPLDRGPTE